MAANDEVLDIDDVVEGYRPSTPSDLRYQAQAVPAPSDNVPGSAAGDDAAGAAADAAATDDQEPVLQEIDGVIIAVQGCCHGQLTEIYASLEEIKQMQGVEVDLLICCGDFQSVRNEADLECMACPPKYRELGDFYKYYNGELVAPVLTLFIGGNHEASNHLQELHCGGWVAPNIYYIGNTGVVQFAGLRIAGLSGIFDDRDFHKPYYEMPPYTPNAQRSAYHVRDIEVRRLLAVNAPIDIMLTHDWPSGIAHFGNLQQLLHCKPYFRDEIASNTLGSPASGALLAHLRPAFWFSAHLHVKYPALVRHPPPHASGATCTRFLALDKVIPGRDFLQIVRIPRRPDAAPLPKRLCYDPEWISIMCATHTLLRTRVPPGPLPKLNQDQLTDILLRLTEWCDTQSPDCPPGNFTIPFNFQVSAPYPLAPGRHLHSVPLPAAVPNPQTDALLAVLQLPHVLTVSALGFKPQPMPSMPPVSTNPDEIDVDDVAVPVAVAAPAVPLRAPAAIVSNPDEINVDDVPCAALAAPRNPEEIDV